MAAALCARLASGLRPITSSSATRLATQALSALAAAGPSSNRSRQCRSWLHQSPTSPPTAVSAAAAGAAFAPAKRALASSASAAHQQQDQWTPEECAERGMALARSPPPLSGETALEALRWLLRAEPSLGRADIWFALGNLHYWYEEEMGEAERAALGAEGAAKSVMQEIQAMRKKAIQERKRRSRSGAATQDKQGAGGIVIQTTDAKLMGPRIGNQEAFQWYTAAAEAGHTGAMLQLADMAVSEPGEAAANFNFAREWYERAAAGAPPQPDALFQLGRAYHEGLAHPEGLPDPQKALENYDRAAAAGSSAALFLLGHAHALGDGELRVPQNARRSREQLEAAVSVDGHPEALYHLALLYLRGDEEAGVGRSEERYLELLSRAAAGGSADAQYEEGDLWRRGGAGRARDDGRALELYEAAAQQQHAEAAYNAAVMRYHGWGCERDARAAFGLYQVAGEAGHVLAWREVASMHMLGDGVPKCEATARHILQVMGSAIRQAEQELLSQSQQQEGSSSSGGGSTP